MPPSFAVGQRLLAMLGVSYVHKVTIKVGIPCDFPGHHQLGSDCHGNSIPEARAAVASRCFGVRATTTDDGRRRVLATALLNVVTRNGGLRPGSSALMFLYVKSRRLCRR